MGETVTVIIKAANQSIPDHHMTCDLGWSVSHLKGLLASQHPSKPRVEEQRLIYSGQLLADNLLLRSVLRHPTENNAYTIHLVCYPPRNTPLSSTSLQTSHRQSLAASSAGVRPTVSHEGSPVAMSTDQTNTSTDQVRSQPTTPAPPDSTTGSDSTDGLRRRHVGGSSGDVSPPPQSTTEPTPFLPQPRRSPNTTGGDSSASQSIDATSTYPAQSHIPVGVVQAGVDPIQQMAAMQQIYAQYMAYMQYMQMGGSVAGITTSWPQPVVQLPASPHPATVTTSAAASTTTTATVAPTSPAPVANQPDQQEQQQDQQNALPDQQQQPQQIRMNAQGGEVEDDDDDEGMGRDWLDWIYVLSRMLVLLSIVYFYSTLSRFMIVVCIAMLLYLYQAGWFRPARRIEQQVAAAAAAAENENDLNNIQDDRNNNINNNNNNNEVPPEIRNQDQEPPAAAEGRGGGGEVNIENNANPAPAGTEGSDQVVEEIPVRPSLLALSWTFLTTFFTSLIPEQPQAL